ncbi:MAG: hypothetical protein J6I73_08425 [Treponema sp.]|nr:hypothetical protein [Treponema sp.]
MNRTIGKRGNMLLLVTVLAAGTLFAAGSRKQIDTFLADYEKIVVKAEKAAENGTMLSLISLQAEAAKLVEKSDKLKDMSDWTEADSVKYLKLTERYMTAITKLSGSLTP